MPCQLKKHGLLCLAFLCLASSANASIEVGDLIRFQNGPGSPGGEFGIARATNPTATEFITFCLEKNEYIDFSNNFHVDSISDSAMNGGVGGGNPDPISAETAWLYYNFREGNLAYEYGTVNQHTNARKNSANSLQNAVWYLEDEQTSKGSGETFVNLAKAEKLAYDTDSNYAGNMAKAIELVRVMNITWATGSRAGQLGQSQLYLLDDDGSNFGAVPEPATVIIWSMMMVGLVIGYRRNLANKPSKASATS